MRKLILILAFAGLVSACDNSSFANFLGNSNACGEYSGRPWDPCS